MAKVRDTDSGPEAVLSESSTLQAFIAVAQQLGADTTYLELQRTYALPPGEVPSGTIISIARDLGLEARSVKANFDDLPKLAKYCPAILRAKDGGGVLLIDSRKDPKVGTVAMIRDVSVTSGAITTVGEDSLSDVWTGEVLLFKRKYAVSQADEKFGARWLLRQVLRDGNVVRDIAAASFVGTFFALAPPFAFMIVLDRVLVNHSVSTLNLVVGALLLFMVFEAVLGFLRRILVETVGTRVDGRLNLFIVERLLRLPMDYFEKNPTGKILSKIARIWQIRHFMTGQLLGALLDAVPLLGLIPAMFILKWQLACICLALSIIVAIIIFLYLKPTGRRYHRVVLAEQIKQAHLVETLYGMRTVKSLALEGRRRREWDVRVAEGAAARHALGMLTNYPQTLSLPFERMIYSGPFAVGAYMILAQPEAMNPGALVAFAMLSLRMAQPLITIARLQNDLAEVRAGIAEVGSVVNVQPEASSEISGSRTPIEGSIEFSGVSFRYGPQMPLALKDVSFRVRRGSMLGIMGRSGSGKTTITRLLQKLHAGYEGLIKIDGVELREINLHHLRTSVGVVPQENFLFSSTVRENISVARPGANFSEIVRVAQLAGAEEFIEHLPRGYETMLEEGASNLSGGQRQRLAIARALLVDPPILILDEATSALDAESEAIVNANLRRIAKGRTVVMVSHRLSMLIDADAIIVMEQGQVYDIGSHEELLLRCDIYRQLWYQQNRHAERDFDGRQQLIPRVSKT